MEQDATGNDAQIKSGRLPAGENGVNSERENWTELLPLLRIVEGWFEIGAKLLGRVRCTPF